MNITDLRRLGSGPQRRALTHIDMRELQESVATEQVATNAPVNAHVLQRANEFKRDLPEFLRKKLKDETDYLLTKVFPHAFTHLNAFADANEVLVSTLGETASVNALFPELEGLVLQAVRSKLIVRVLTAFDMSEAEAKLFLLRVLSPEGKTNDLQTLMHEVQSLVDLHRAPERAKLPVQQLPQAQRNRRGTRIRVPANGTPIVPDSDAQIHEKLKAARAARSARGQQKAQAPAARRRQAGG